MKLILVSCVAGKQPAGHHPARNLYTSAWFSKARAYVEQQKPDAWYILSAKYGLLHPDRVIWPYEMSLHNMAVQERRAWARRVLRQMTGMEGGTIEVLAGKRYREFLMPGLRGCSRNVTVPMEGMQIGEQLRWLNEQIFTIRRSASLQKLLQGSPMEPRAVDLESVKEAWREQLAASSTSSTPDLSKPFWRPYLDLYGLSTEALPITRFRDPMGVQAARDQAEIDRIAAEYYKAWTTTNRPEEPSGPDSTS